MQNDHQPARMAGSGGDFLPLLCGSLKNVPGTLFVTTMESCSPVACVTRIWGAAAGFFLGDYGNSTVFTQHSAWCRRGAIPRSPHHDQKDASTRRCSRTLFAAVCLSQSHVV